MAELLFKVKADYEEAIRCRDELQRLRSEMLRLDDSTEEGAKKMEELSKRYKEVDSALTHLTQQAAENAIYMKQGILGIEDAFVSMMNEIKKGENVTNQVFSAMKGMATTIEEEFDYAQEAIITTAETLEEKLGDLTRERNLAEAKGDDIRVRQLDEEISAIEKNIEANEALREEIQESLKDYQDLGVELGNAINAYEQLLDKKASNVDMTEEEANALKEEMAEAIDNILEKFQEYEGGLKEMPSVLGKVKQAASEANGTGEKLSPMIEKLITGEKKLSAQTIDLAKNIARMVLPANAAKVAIAGLSGGLVGMGVAAAGVIIAKLIQKYKEAKKAAEEARKEQEEFYEQVAKGAAPSISKFEGLKRSWMSLSTEMEKTQFLDENRKALNDLGISIDDINKLEAVFHDNTKKYWDAQITRARADAYRAKITKNIAEQLELEEKLNAPKKMKKVWDPNAGTTTEERDVLTGPWGGKPGEKRTVTRKGAWVEVEDITKKELSQREKDQARLDQLKADIVELGELENQTRKKFEDEMNELNSLGMDANYKETLTSRMDDYKKAKAEYEKVLADTGSTRDAVKKARDEMEAASNSYKSAAGESPESVLKRQQDAAKNQRKLTEAEQKAREEAVKKYGNDIKKLIEATEKEIAEAQANAIKADSKGVLKALDDRLREEKGKQEEILAIFSEYGGNVNLAKRPQISDIELAKKGWFPMEDITGSIATVYSSSFGIDDAKGQRHEVLVTPILPDGSVLSPEELDNYVDTILNGANDILAADKKGIVIGIDLGEEAGEELHELQDMFYNIIPQNIHDIMAERAETLVRSVDEVFFQLKQELDEKMRELDEQEEAIRGDSKLDEDSRADLLAGVNNARRAATMNYDLRRKNRISELVSDINKKGMLTLEEEDVEDDLQDLLLQYGDYEQKRVAIHLKWLGQIEAADEEHKAIYQQMFSSELLELAKTSGGALEKVFGNVSQYTRKQVAAARAQLREFKNSKEYKNLSVNDKKALAEAENALLDADIEKQFRVGNASVGNFIKTMTLLNAKQEEYNRKVKAGEDGTEELKKEIDQLKETAGLDAIATGASLAIKGISKLSSILKEVASNTNNQGLAKTADALSVIAEAGSAAMEGYQATGSAYGAIAFAAVNLFGQMIDSANAADKAFNDSRIAYSEFLKSLGKIATNQKIKDGLDSIFGTYLFQNINNAADAIADLDVRYQNYANNWNSRNLNAIGGYVLGDGKTSWDSLEARKAAIASMLVTTQKGSFWNWKWSKENGLEIGKDEKKTLQELIGLEQLYNEEGYANVEVLKNLLNTMTDLTEDEKRALNEFIQESELANAALDQIKSSLSSVFSDMSSLLADATINGLKSGAEIGSYEMKQIVSGSIKDLQKNLVMGIYQRYLSSYEDEIIKMATSGNLNEEELVRKYAEMIDKIGETVAVATNAANRFGEVAQQHGFNLDEIENAQGSVGSYQSITETTGSAIEGRLASLQISAAQREGLATMTNASIAEMLRLQMESITLERDIRNIHADAYLALVAIRNNTSDNLAQVKEIKGLVTNIEVKTRNL